MPTPSEKKALLFLASVAVLGASVRALRAVGNIDKVPVASAQALDGQLAAVDSARGAKKDKGKKGKGRHRLPPDTMPARPAAAPPSVPNVKPGRPATSFPIDVDVATAEQLDTLPGVGPVLARRIVVDRDKRGPFGSLANLRRVKGIGPALAARLDSLVTFSGTPRPLSATPADSSDTERRGARRGRSAIRLPTLAPPPRPRLSLPESWPPRSSPSSE
jgi:competence protein ComEA